MENNIEESFKNLFDIDENPKSIEELMEGIENPTTSKPSNNLEEMFKELQETRDNKPEHVAESVDWDGKPLTEKQIEAKKMEIETLQKFLTKNLIAKKLEPYQDFDLEVKPSEEKKSSFVDKIKKVFKKQDKVPSLHVEILGVDKSTVYGKVNDEMFKLTILNEEDKTFILHYIDTVVKNNSTYYQIKHVSEHGCVKTKCTEKTLPKEIREYIQIIENAEMVKNENTL